MKSLLFRALCVYLVGAFVGVLALDETQRELVRDTVDAVLSAPPFENTKVEHTHRYRGDIDLTPGEPEPESDPNRLLWLIDLVRYFAQFSEMLLWLGVGVLIYVIVRYRDRWLGLLPERATRVDPRLPRAIFGEDEAKAALPEDIVQQALIKLQSADTRGALSLLYRGSLLYLIKTKHIELSDSSTEEDCLRLVVPAAPQATGEYFTRLTRLWQATAYGAIELELESAQSLCMQWSDHFGEML